MSIRQTILDNLHKYKPSNKEKTNETYYNLIKNDWLGIMMKAKTEPIDSIDFLLKDPKKVLEYLKKKYASSNTVKTHLAAYLPVLASFGHGDSTQYRFYNYRVNEMQVVYTDQRASQMMTDRQKKNFISWSVLETIPGIIKKRINYILEDSERELSASEFMLVQEWVIASLYMISETNEPVRLDYANMRVLCGEEYDTLPEATKDDLNYLVCNDDIGGDDDEKDDEEDDEVESDEDAMKRLKRMKKTELVDKYKNKKIKGFWKMNKGDIIDAVVGMKLHLDDKKPKEPKEDKPGKPVVNGKSKYSFHFHKYKTSGVYGATTVDVGNKLEKVLDVWLKINDSGFLLLTKSQNIMSTDFLSKTIITIIKKYLDTDKNIGVSMLRTAKLSAEYVVDKPNQRSESARRMMHSVGTSLTYQKYIEK
jgi:hypothetical protein